MLYRVVCTKGDLREGRIIFTAYDAQGKLYKVHMKFTNKIEWFREDEVSITGLAYDFAEDHVYELF